MGNGGADHSSDRFWYACTEDGVVMWLTADGIVTFLGSPIAEAKFLFWAGFLLGGCVTFTIIRLKDLLQVKSWH